MLSPYAESWEIIELLSRTSRENWSSWNGWKEESWWKKSTILLDNLKRMAIFALFSYELGRQVKASIFSLKGMLAFFYCPIPRGYYNKDGCSLNFLTISMQNENCNAIFNRYGILGPFWDTYYTYWKRRTPLNQLIRRRLMCGWRDSNPYACAPDPKSGLSTSFNTPAKPSGRGI